MDNFVLPGLRSRNEILAYVRIRNPLLFLGTKESILSLESGGAFL